MNLVAILWDAIAVRNAVVFSSESLGLTDFSEVDVLGSWYKFVNFVAEKSPVTTLVSPNRLRQQLE